MFADVDYKGNEIWRKNWGNFTEGTFILNSRMIYSTIFNKNTNEDPKTSMVFENLMLLPDSVFWDILKNAASNQGVLPKDAGLLTEFSFWPKWEPHDPYETGNESCVEPDVFFRFRNIDVIVEAKYSDCYGQYRDEWEREFRAYLNQYRHDNKKVVLLAVGGNGTFDREPDLVVNDYICPIVKYSWVNMLNAVLDYEKSGLLNVREEDQSPIKRLIRNIENGCEIVGIFKNYKKVELKGLRNLYTLGKIFYKAIDRVTTDSYSLVYNTEEMNSYHYGYQFTVKPKDDSKKPIKLSIAFWIDDEEVLTIQARNSFAPELFKMIADGESISSTYTTLPSGHDQGYEDSYFFYANDKFYQDFAEAATFDAQVEIVSKFIDDVCQYYLTDNK